MSEAHSEPSLLDAEVRRERQLHYVPSGVECEAIGRRATEFHL